MKCINCEATMTTKRENVPYRSLPNTVLVGVEVSRCANCCEYEVAIPAVDDLNKLLASDVVRKEGRLSGGEIRFLRTYPGYSSGDFAKLLDVNPSTVSRWESDAQPIGHAADLLLRAMAMLDKKVESYPIAELAKISSESVDPKRKRAFVRSSSKRWARTELQA